MAAFGKALLGTHFERLRARPEQFFRIPKKKRKVFGVLLSEQLPKAAISLGQVLRRQVPALLAGWLAGWLAG